MVPLNFTSASFDPAFQLPIVDHDFKAAQDNKLFVIQHEHVAGKQVLAAVKAIPGAHFIGYVVKDGFLFYFANGHNEALTRIANIRGIVPFHPMFKFHQDLWHAIEKEDLKNRDLPLFVQAFTGIPQFSSNLRSKLESIGATVTEAAHPYYDIILPNSQLAALARIPEVQHIRTSSKARTEMNVSAQILNLPVGWTSVNNGGFGLSGIGQFISFYDVTGFDRATPCDNSNVSAAMGVPLPTCAVANNALMLDLQGGLYSAIGLAVNADVVVINPNANLTGTLTHGTSVVGAAVGNGDISTIEGVNPPIVGAAPLSPIIYINSGGGDIYWQSRYEFAAAMGARIHSNSIGNTTNLSTYKAGIDSVVDNFLRDYPYNVVSCSAGNYAGVNLNDVNNNPLFGFANTISSPSVAKNVIAVGNSENNKPTAYNQDVPGAYADNPVQLNLYSSTGPVRQSNRMKPDVVAPGSSIASTKSSAAQVVGATAAPFVRYRYSQLPLPPETTPLTTAYEYHSGTSLAAPQVSGVLALLRQYLMGQTILPLVARVPDLNGPTGELLKAMLINGTVDIYSDPNAVPPGTGGFRCQGVQPNNAGDPQDPYFECSARTADHIPSNDQGWGRIDLSRILTPCGKKLCEFFDASNLNRVYNGFEVEYPVNPVLLPTFINSGDQKTYRVRLSRTQPVSMSLAWYDLVDQANTGILVNNLDLSLSGFGNIYRGGVNGFIPAQGQPSDGLSLPDRPADDINTTEKIVLNEVPADGFYNVTIRADTIVAGSTQTFGFAMSGINGVDSVDRDGEYRYTFFANQDPPDSVSVKAVGLMPNTQVHVYIIAYNMDNQFLGNAPIQLQDVRGAYTTLTSSATGTLQGALWNNPVVGAYNIVIDVPDAANQFDGFYVKGTDMVDYSDRVGFTVLQAFNFAALPVVMPVAAMNQGNVQPLAMFAANQAGNASHSPVLLQAENLPENIQVNAYVVEYQPKINWNGLPLESIKVPFNQNPLPVWTNSSGQIATTIMWDDINNTTVVETGKRYVLVVDVNKNGVFDVGIDVRSYFNLTPLEGSLPLRLGSEGESVKVLKRFLNLWSGSTLDYTNAIFDQGTETALRKFSGLPEVNQQLLLLFEDIADIGFMVQPSQEDVSTGYELPALADIFDNFDLHNVRLASGARFYTFDDTADIADTTMQSNTTIIVNADQVTLGNFAPAPPPAPPAENVTISILANSTIVGPGSRFTVNGHQNGMILIITPSRANPIHDEF